MKHLNQLSNRFRNVDLNLLKVFYAIYCEQNISKAAQMLCVSQPAVSNALKRLREMYDDPLFVRTAEGMMPSPRAQELAQPIQEALRYLEGTLVVEDRFRPETSNRTFTVALTDYGEFYFLPRLVRKLAEQAPGVEVICLPNAGASLAVELRAGTVDLAWDWVRIDDQEYFCEPLFEDDGYCLVRRNHPEIEGELNLEQYLAAEHVALRPTRSHQPRIERALESGDLQRKVVVEVSHLTVLPGVVANTNLIATMPQRLAEFYADVMDLQVLKNPVYDDAVIVYQMWHSHFAEDEGHQWFRRLAKQVVLEDGVPGRREGSAQVSSGSD
ncbi:LysR substrate-binding domain-containing protein [Elongatibacter sediminis]|uniref:LysR substrate-binding domain-containing protein n=1 Tax=Elongatibacter sediminis TaxID=3119006 RepID=A0AAW9R5Q2_9GAMM